MQTPTQTPIEWLVGLIRNTVFAMTTLCISGRMPHRMSGLILQRLSRIKDCVARTAARVEAGQYRPRRRSGRPRSPAIRRPWQPGELPRHKGWLAALVPVTAPGNRGLVESLLHRPDMVALITAAPTTLIPPLRSLCWALDFKPPPILARPRRERPPAESAPPPPAEPSDPARARPPQAPPPARRRRSPPSHSSAATPSPGVPRAPQLSA
jgi:hypothetical protein